ncbi:forkhead-associated domain-containing protein / FHA domain-containing protein [Zea mays]|uniref:Cysteine protease n=1 Tax=Zea mays TaxID=4577 RepID=A0A1D6FJ05_MAIZE|nr:forkhead-associated domain-containing protein / FHA domain-containing protein [Zea mays]
MNYQASSRWEKRQAKVLEKVRRRMSQDDSRKGGSWSDIWGAPTRYEKNVEHDRYIPLLKETFMFPQSLGILGGKPGTSTYIAGVQDDRALYLDPHEVQMCILADILMLDWVTSEHLVPTLDCYSGEKDKDENGDEAPSKVLANIKWPETLETDFIYSALSFGTSINPQFIASFASAAGKRPHQDFDSQESDPEWGWWTANHELKKPSISLLFPTIILLSRRHQQQQQRC